MSDDNTPVTKKRRRSRTLKACEFCRKRKIKCDRTMPCSGCSKYGQICKYMKKDGVKQENVSDLQEEVKILRERLRVLENSNRSDETDDEEEEEDDYDELCEQSEEENQNFGDIMSMIGNNKYASAKDTISLFDGYTAIRAREPIRRRSFGPFSWLSFLRRDPVLHKLWWYIETNYGEKKRIKMLRLTKMSASVDSEFAAKISNEEGLDDLKPYKTSEEPENLGSKMAENGGSSQVIEETSEHVVRMTGPVIRNTSVGTSSIFYNRRRDEERVLKDYVLKVLPPKRIIHCLFRRYFTHVYPYIPIVDEMDLEEHLNSLMDFSSFETAPKEEMVSKISIEKRMDFANLGILLLIIRFGYLTITPNLSFVNDPFSPSCPNKDYLKNNSVSGDLVEVAQMCLSQFNMMRTGNIVILQLGLLTRFYNLYAPEDGEGVDGGDAQVFNAMLVNMAYSLGLNRDPDNFPIELPNKRTNHLTRKIWTCLMTVDINYSLTNGTPMIISANCYDTKEPYFDKDNSNIRDQELEKLTVSWLSSFSSVFKASREMLEFLLNMNNSVKIVHLIKKLTEFEKIYFKEFRDLKKEFTSSTSDFSTFQVIPKVRELKVSLVLVGFMMGIYFILFTHYEKKKEYKISFYYARKILLTTVEELMPFYFELYQNSYIAFVNTSDITLLPELQGLCHKSIIFLTAFYIRGKLWISNLEASEDHVSKLQSDHNYTKHLQELALNLSLVRQCTTVLRSFIARLRHKYYYAWRVTKAQSFIGKIVFSNNFFQENCKEFDGNYHFSTEDLQNFNDILSRNLNKIDYQNIVSSADLVQGAPIEQQQNEDAQTPLNDIKATNIQPQQPNGETFVTDDQVDMLWMQMMKKEQRGESNWHLEQNVANTQFPTFVSEVATPQAYNMPPSFVPGMTPSSFTGSYEEVFNPDKQFRFGEQAVGYNLPYMNNWLMDKDALGYESLIMSTFGMGPDDAF